MKLFDLFDLRVKITVWWRINISGDLRLGEFLRFVLDQPHQKEETP